MPYCDVRGQHARYHPAQGRTQQHVELGHGREEEKHAIQLLERPEDVHGGPRLQRVARKRHTLVQGDARQPREDHVVGCRVYERRHARVEHQRPPRDPRIDHDFRERQDHALGRTEAVERRVKHAYSDRYPNLYYRPRHYYQQTYAHSVVHRG